MVLMAKPASRRVTTLVLPADRAREYTSAMVAAEPNEGQQRRCAEAEGRPLGKEGDTQGRAKGRPSRRSDDVRVGNRIAEEPLK